MHKPDQNKFMHKANSLWQQLPFRLSSANIFFLCVIIGISFLLRNIYISNAMKEQNGIIKQQLSVIADQIEDVIDSRLFMLNELESYVKASPEINQAIFGSIAQRMLERDHSLRSLQLARNNVISHVYPLTNNKAALGHDLLNDSNRDADVKIALSSNTATISGPVNLRQGGLALIVRKTIELTSNNNQSTSNWGLSALVFDWDEVLQETDLVSLFNKENIALRAKMLGKWQPAFWGDNSLFNEDSDTLITIDIPLPNRTWQLAALPDNTKFTALANVVLIVSAIIILLIYYLQQIIHRQTWAAPLALVGIFILFCGVTLGLSYYSVDNEHKQQLLEKAEDIRVDIRNRLKDSLDYLLLLSLSRSSSNLSSIDFQNRASEYVAVHPEMINITWIDADFIIRDVAPLKGNQQIIGLKVDLEEPKRASRLAKELRLPVYTHPFVAIQGPSSFEVWVPIFHNNEFIGLFAGVYSVPDLFKTTLSKNSLSHFGITMVTHDGQIVDRSLLKDNKEIDMSQTVALSPPGYDIALRLDRYKTQMWRLETITLALLAFSLAMGLFWGIFVLLRARTALQLRYQQLCEVRDALHTEKELSQVTLLSIGEGVITMDADGKINSLNPVAETITQWSTSRAEGKFLYEIMPLVDTKHQQSMEQILLNCIQDAMQGKNSSTMGLLQNKQQYSLRCTLAPIKNKRGEAIGSVLVLHDITEMHLMTQELEHRAKHDSLTGLVNRQEFKERLQRAIYLAKQNNCTHSLLYLDLDQFKIINDTCGHLAGDELLMQLTSLLQERIRSTDTLARLGGDEFGILLMNCTLVKSIGTAESLRKLVDNFRFVWQDSNFSLGVSIGLVQIDEDTDSYTNILSVADVACYMAKEGGRNQVHVYTEDDEETSKRHGEMHWVTHITSALENDHFELYHQTIQPLNKTHLGEHYEILIRMHASDGSLINPGTFLPAAERYDMMLQIDRWVFNSTLKFFQRYPYRLETLQLCSINVSAQSLSNEEFLNYLITSLQDNRRLCSKLCFEITETSVVSNMIQAKHFISSLAELGCQFSLDDFGSGMSSFGYLKNLPVDYLKIDGSLVKDCARDPIDLAMVKSINDVGHMMKMGTIAEWVEDEATQTALASIGIDYVQGYFIGKPQPLIGKHIY